MVESTVKHCNYASDLQLSAGLKFGFGLTAGAGFLGGKFTSVMGA
jgi:hypothetical protein